MTSSLMKKHSKCDPHILKDELCNKGRVKRWGDECMVINSDRTYEEIIERAYNRTISKRLLR